MLGKLYNDGWNRQSEPTEVLDYKCIHCQGYRAEQHIIHKRFYYPWTHWKVRTVYVCMHCGNEEEVTTTTVKLGKPETAAQRFMKLPVWRQKELLDAAGELSTKKGGE